MQRLPNVLVGQIASYLGTFSAAALDSTARRYRMTEDAWRRHYLRLLDECRRLGAASESFATMVLQVEVPFPLEEKQSSSSSSSSPPLSSSSASKRARVAAPTTTLSGGRTGSRAVSMRLATMRAHNLGSKRLCEIKLRMMRAAERNLTDEIHEVDVGGTVPLDWQRGLGWSREQMVQTRDLLACSWLDPLVYYSMAVGYDRTNEVGETYAVGLETFTSDGRMLSSLCTRRQETTEEGCLDLTRLVVLIKNDEDGASKDPSVAEALTYIYRTKSVTCDKTVDAGAVQRVADRLVLLPELSAFKDEAARPGFVLQLLIAMAFSRQWWQWGLYKTALPQLTAVESKDDDDDDDNKGDHQLESAFPALPSKDFARVAGECWTQRIKMHGNERLRPWEGGDGEDKGYGEEAGAHVQLPYDQDIEPDEDDQRARLKWQPVSAARAAARAAERLANDEQDDDSDDEQED